MFGEWGARRMSAEAILAVVIVVLLIASVLVTLARDVCLWASGREHLRIAVKFRDAAAVRMLLDASPQVADDPEALFLAIFLNRDETLVVLLERGADVRRRLEWGGAALHVAARYGTVETVRAVLAHGADIDEDCGGTPLYWAADQGRPEVVELLLRCGANATLVPVEEVGRSAFKPKFTGREGFEAIRQRLAEAQRMQVEPSALADATRGRS
jgi:ankyrin repeat protein